MVAFNVTDMSCGHCVGTITQALKAVDPGARVEIDLARRVVSVEPSDADPADLADAITEAGYTPALLAQATSVEAAGAGSCCGHCR